MQPSRTAQQARTGQSVRLAAIDLGTVTSRLLIADVRDSIIHERERHMRITHLGERLDETGVVGQAAIERELAACKEFLAAIAAAGREDGQSISQICAVATSAMRDAANRDEVLARLREVGLEVTVIAGTREAELSFEGTISGFAQGFARGNLLKSSIVLDSSPILTLDVGGGSTELILGSLCDITTPRHFRTDVHHLDKQQKNKPQIIVRESFDIGSRRLTERFLLNDPPLPNELVSARHCAQEQLRAFYESFELCPKCMIAVSGTATSALTVRDAVAVYDPWKIHGQSMTLEELKEVLDKLANISLTERKHCPGLEPERASVIIGGLIILQAALELAGLSSFTVSETDILHGILLDASSTRF